MKPEFSAPLLVRPLLVVDDMPAVRSIIRGMLEDLGFTQVEEAEDGEHAWRLVRERFAPGANPALAYAMVLTDWLMPGLEGTELVREIRGFAPTRDLPVLMITSQGQRDQWAEARSAGVTGFVVKPFDESQLAQEIARIVLPPARAT